MSKLTFSPSFPLGYATWPHKIRLKRNRVWFLTNMCTNRVAKTLGKKKKKKKSNYFKCLTHKPSSPSRPWLRPGASALCLQSQTKSLPGNPALQLVGIMGVVWHLGQPRSAKVTTIPISRERRSPAGGVSSRDGHASLCLLVPVSRVWTPLLTRLGDTWAKASEKRKIPKTDTMNYVTQMPWELCSMSNPTNEAECRKQWG